LPVLFDASLEVALAPYRRFRHVALHSYGFQLEWSRMIEGMAAVETVFAQITAKLTEYLRIIERSERTKG
jgi:hypothetical protein